MGVVGGQLGGIREHRGSEVLSVSEVQASVTKQEAEAACKGQMSKSTLQFLKKKKLHIAATFEMITLVLF